MSFTPITLNLDSEQVRILKELAKRDGLTPSAITRLALRRYLADRADFLSPIPTPRRSKDESEKDEVAR
jgi:predicted transcriptional regulator